MKRIRNSGKIVVRKGNSATYFKKGHKKIGGIKKGTLHTKTILKEVFERQAKIGMEELNKFYDILFTKSRAELADILKETDLPVFLQGQLFTLLKNLTKADQNYWDKFRLEMLEYFKIRDEKNDIPGSSQVNNFIGKDINKDTVKLVTELSNKMFPSARTRKLEK